MIVWEFHKLFHERVSLTGVSTMIIQNFYLMSCDGQKSARSMESREEASRNSLVCQFGLSKPFPCPEPVLVHVGPKQELFLHEHLAGDGQERQPWAVGIGFVQAPVLGLPSAVLHWPQPFPSKCANPQEHPTSWVCPLDCFVQLLAACCLCAGV